MRSVRRLLRPRISLRAAAIVLTLACVWLGLWTHSARRQQKAVADLTQLGASVIYDGTVEDVWAPEWLVRFVGDDYFRDVVSVHLRYRTEKRRMHRLTPAEFDAAVAAMTELPSLASLLFSHTGVTDDDLARFAPLADQVEQLYFNESRQLNLTGDALTHLATWSRLKSLGMPFGVNNPQALESLEKFPALTELTWSGSPLDAEDFAAIARCRKLESLTLRSSLFYGAALVRLRDAPALKRVMLLNTIPVHFSRYLSGQTNIMPADDDPNNEFEFIPDSGDAPWDPNAPVFPAKEFHDWLERVLPAVDFSEMSVS